TSLAERATQISDKPINFAEAFRQHRGHAYPNDNVLAALLGESIYQSLITKLMNLHFTVRVPENLVRITS
nr:hypothetical protein [Acidobacteriota bacterium]